MHSRYLNGVTIRPLRYGDTRTVSAVFDRLSEESRRPRGGVKPRLSEAELDQLARVDRDHHVLVAYVDGDPLPAGIARLTRRGRTAEVAFAVTDEHQRRGIRSALAEELAADARSAGIVELHATVTGQNRPALSLLSRTTRRLQSILARADSWPKLLAFEEFESALEKPNKVGGLQRVHLHRLSHR